MPYFPARLDFPSPPLSAPGSPRMPIQRHCCCVCKDCRMTSQVYKMKGAGHKDRANPPFCFYCWSHCDFEARISSKGNSLFFYWVLVRWRRNLKTVLNSAKFLFKSLATRFLLQSRGGARNFWLGVQTLVQKGLLNFFCGKLELLLTETTTRFSICERQSLLAREILLCKQTQTDDRQLHFWITLEFSLEAKCNRVFH